MAERSLFGFDEIGKEHNDLVGKKCANIGEMRKIGLRTPAGFALTVEAYKEFMGKTGAGAELQRLLIGFDAAPTDVGQFEEKGRLMRRIVQSKRLPEEMEYMIVSHYAALCETCRTPEVAVATRSAGTASHPGQYETYLNVRGRADVLENIVKVWSSTFNTRSLISRARAGLPLDSDPIGVAVLQMVNARCAGVCFTADPFTGDHSRIKIEASWGLGESVVGGMVMPDSWTLDKESVSVLEKKLGRKSVQVVTVGRGVKVVGLPEDRANTFCMTDEEAMEIGYLGKILESHFGVPQDLEFAIDSDLPFPDNVFLLQARAQVIQRRESPVNRILDQIFKAGLKS